MVASAPTRPFTQDEAIVNGLPNICGNEAVILEAVNHSEPIFLNETNLNLADVSAGFACALHMHQPTIPAGPNGGLISNLQHMFENPGDGDNHNAHVFASCYSRMGDWIAELVMRGQNPRIMLDYSGNLFWGFKQMGRTDIIDNLKLITCDSTYQPYVEWLGTMWSHAVATSTPIPDLKLHILAWQHHFAAVFGWDALARVKGFSPPEMHLPNHPDTLYEYVKALKECGYRWLMVQEHSLQTLNGEELKNKHTPHKLVARNSKGETVSITALIKTQGSDTKLVAQMQPYYEAKSLNPQGNFPPIVTQIGDGENGGVMMNEFPPGYKQAWHDMAQNGGGKTGVVGVNGTEYLELIENAGANPEDYPACQPVGQHLIWERVSNTKTVEQVIEELKQENPNFHMDGASWTNNISWVEGYENVLDPMNKLSSLFHQKFGSLLQADESITQKSEYRKALLYNLLLQTSCFRYWGQGTWTDYAREIYRLGEEVINS